MASAAIADVFVAAMATATHTVSGVASSRARERDARLAYTGHGPWRIARKPLGRLLNVTFWQQQGLESVTARYHRLREAW